MTPQRAFCFWKLQRVDVSHCIMIYSVKGADNEQPQIRRVKPSKNRFEHLSRTHILLKLLFKNFHRSTTSLTTPTLKFLPCQTHTNIMPSFAELLGLGAFTSWLSGSSKTETDAASSSAEAEIHAKPSKQQTITISSDVSEGKTFEEAMAAISSSSTDSVETDELADELADELQGITLSENVIPNSGTGSHCQTECENAEGSSIKNAALQDSSNLEPGCQCCGLASQIEYAITKVKQAADCLGPGSTEYFE